MNRIEDMTHEEIVALTDEEIDNMIKYYCAEKGIKFLPVPVKPEIVKIDNDVMFEWNGLITADKELLEKFRKLFEDNRYEFVSDSYFSDIGYDYKYASPIEKYDYDRLIEIATRKFYSKEKLEQYRKELAKYKSDNVEYERLIKEYKENEQTKNDHIGWIIEKINIHKQMERNLKTYIELIENQYCDLAENNAQIAFNFFKKAYPNVDEWTIFKIKEHMNLNEEGYIEPDINIIVDVEMQER